MRIAGILILTLLPFAGISQTFTATVNKTAVSTSETFQYTMTLTNAEGEIRKPDFSDFLVVGGPSVGNSMQIINGKRTREYSETYALRPKKEGKFTIQPAAARTSAGVLKSGAVQITVTKGSVIPPSQSTADLFTVVQLSKRKVHIGEPLVATYKVYTSFRELSAEELDIPQPEGFWSEEIDTQEQWRDEVINGRRMQSYVLKRELLFPQTSGTLETGKFSITGLCRNSFFQRPQRLTANTPSKSIEVMPLPTGKAGDHIGTYTNLKVTANIDRNSIQANEAVNLSVRFNGTGNMKLVGQPKIDFPSDFEVFDPKIKDQIRVNTNGESGSRVFEYVVIPRSPGNFVIPSISGSYFDFRKNQYERFETGPIKMTVARGTNNANNSYTFDSKTDVNILTQDIRYIKTNSIGLQPLSSRFFGSIPFYGLLSLPWIIFLLAFFYKKSVDKRSEDSVGFRQKKAIRVAKKHLQKASHLAGKGDTTLFFDELYRATFGYLGDKLAIPPSELNRDQIKRNLGAKIDEGQMSELMSVIDLCERARFSPIQETEELESLEKVRAIIHKIEKG